MLNRYYFADMRRFISTDPSGIDSGVNLYAYGNLNPLFYSDPFGLEAGNGWWSSVGRAGLDVIGKIWNAPNTAIGLVWGAAGYAAGLLPGVSMPTISFNNNAIQFENHPLMPSVQFVTPNGVFISHSGVTLGNAISYSGNSWDLVPTYDMPSLVEIGDHERFHTYQSQRDGIFFLPSYFYMAGYLPTTRMNKMLTTMREG